MVSEPMSDGAKETALIEAVNNFAVASKMTNEQLIGALSYSLATMLRAVVTEAPREARSVADAYVAAVLGTIRRQAARGDVVMPN
jgi:hypothetical protein